MLTSVWLRQKEMLLHTGNKAERADQREIRARVMEVVRSHQFYLMSEKKPRSLSIISEVKPAV